MALKNLEEAIVDRIVRALTREMKRLRGRPRSASKGCARGSSIRRVGAAMVACALLPASARLQAAGTPPSASVARDTGRPQPEILFDTEDGRVTVRVGPDDLRDIRFRAPLRHRLTVLENGVRQPGVRVAVEHSPITLAVLIENGGRSHQLNESVTADAAMLTRPLLDALAGQDRLAVFAYDDSVHTIVDFDTPQEQWAIGLGRLPKPRFSESNFYDATLSVLERLEGMSGRKALWILSTGIDTFSRATSAEVLARAKEAKVPVYVINLGEFARRRLPAASWGPLAHVDWPACERHLGELADASGGRAYLKASSLDVEGIYDEVLDELRVRYVLTYSASRSGPPLPRVVQVALLDAVSPARAKPGDALRAGDGVRVIAEAIYTPVGVPAAASAGRAHLETSNGR